MSVSACSMRAYAAITARRGSGSRRRSSIASSSALPSSSSCSGVRRPRRSRRRSTMTAATIAATMRAASPIASDQTNSGYRSSASCGLGCSGTTCPGRTKSAFPVRPREPSFRRMSWPAITAVRMITRKRRRGRHTEARLGGPAAASQSAEPGPDRDQRGEDPQDEEDRKGAVEDSRRGRPPTASLAAEGLIGACRHRHHARALAGRAPRWRRGVRRLPPSCRRRPHFPAHRRERVDGSPSHRLVDGVLGELRNLEQLRERSDRALRLQLAPHPGRYSSAPQRLAGEPVDRQGPLHARVGGNDRPARVGIATEILDRLVESRPAPQLLGRERVRQLTATRG